MREDELAEVTAVAARAFWHDPLIDFFARDLLHEYRLLPGSFSSLFADLACPAGGAAIAESRG
ncbi:MAG: hypothetical protein DYH08_00155 [Actinobacteria bacterium ATB1]|nr:hypothetical protein [Actinobacteria bacterium ATB1]